MAKDIHIDLLEIDKQVGKYWLDESEKRGSTLNPKLTAQLSGKLAEIRKRNRDKWLAKKKREAT